MTERELIELRLEYSTLFMMHQRLAQCRDLTDKEVREYVELAHAYEIGLHYIEHYLYEPDYAVVLDEEGDGGFSASWDNWKH